MEHFERIPAAHRHEARATDRVASLDDLGVGMRTVHDFAKRPPRAPWVVDRSLRGEPQRHALLERAAVVGDGDEMAHERLDEPVSAWDRAQHVGERAAARPPELVDIAVDHPVRAVLARGETRHARYPLSLPERPIGLADHPHPTVSLVSGQHVLGAVARRVIGDEDEVDACTQVELEMLLDDVALVAREQGHHDSHGRNPRPGQTKPRWTSSNVTTCERSPPYASTRRGKYPASASS